MSAAGSRVLRRDLDDQLARRLPPDQVPLRLAHAVGRERVLGVHVHPERAVGEEPEQLPAVHPALLGRVDVVAHPARGASEQRRRREGEGEGETHVGRRSRTFFSTSLRGGKGGTAPDAFPTETMVPFRRIILKSASNLHRSRRQPRLLPLRAQLVHGGEPRSDSRVLPDAVEDRVHALPAGDLAHAPHRVLLRVQHDVVRAVRARERGLGGRARRPEHRRAARLRELREEQAEPARDGVHEHRVARAHGVRLGDERERRRACRALKSAWPAREGGGGEVRGGARTLREPRGGSGERQRVGDGVGLVPRHARVLDERTQPVLRPHQHSARARQPMCRPHCMRGRHARSRPCSRARARGACTPRPRGRARPSGARRRRPRPRCRAAGGTP